MALLSRLPPKIDAWVAAKIISPEQRGQILAYENSHNRRLFWRASIGIGATFVVLGICFLIASNWQAIPAALKLSAAFLLLGASLGATYRYQVLKAPAKFKYLGAYCNLTSFVLIAATIGLIGQIFHLDGGWENFALLWAILSIPLLILDRSYVLGFLWPLIAYCGLVRFHWIRDWFIQVIDWLFEIFKNHLISISVGLAMSYGLYFVFQSVHQRWKDSCILFQVAAYWMLAFAYGALLSMMWMWGIQATWSGTTFLANFIIFAFLALRSWAALNQHNSSSFGRHIIFTEFYIYLLFATHVRGLFSAGITFILTGLTMIAFIITMRKTLKYIKKMGHFR